MPTIKAETLERVTRDIFVAWGVPKDDAACVAEQLVLANLRGHDSHGAIRIPQYVQGPEERRDQPHAPHHDRRRPSGHRRDRRRPGPRPGGGPARDGGDHRQGEGQGLSAVALRGTTHVGRLADYAETAAAAGLVGMVWANAVGGLNVAPWGGAARRLGTNPHAVAIPGPEAPWPCRTTSPPACGRRASSA